MFRDVLNLAVQVDLCNDEMVDLVVYLEYFLGTVLEYNNISHLDDMELAGVVLRYKRHIFNIFEPYGDDVCVKLDNILNF